MRGKNRSTSEIEWLAPAAFPSRRLCSHSSNPSVRTGPGSLAAVRVEDWSYAGEPAKRVVTPHYVVYATVTNDDFLESVGQLMEGALAEYMRLAPDTPKLTIRWSAICSPPGRKGPNLPRRKQATTPRFIFRSIAADIPFAIGMSPYLLGDVGTRPRGLPRRVSSVRGPAFQIAIPPFLGEGNRLSI